MEAPWEDMWLYYSSVTNMVDMWPNKVMNHDMSG